MQTQEGGIALRFEHPTLAGTAVGGWMNRAEDQPLVKTASVSRMYMSRPQGSDNCDAIM